MGELLIEAFWPGLDIDGSAQRHVESVPVDHENDAAAGSFFGHGGDGIEVGEFADNAIESRIPFSDYVERKCIARREVLLMHAHRAHRLLRFWRAP